ncbi:MAG TPA: hypothetical protein VEB43_07730 [Anaeromyxobacter sp.]|nr:hypothetical protein [Anaeromyxobacter sp.]
MAGAVPRRDGTTLFPGEFGVIREGFAGKRDGAAWVADVLELVGAEGVSFSYHVLHEEAFGLYGTSASQPPARRNAALAEVLAGKPAPNAPWRTRAPAPAGGRYVHCTCTRRYVCAAVVGARRATPIARRAHVC